DETTADLLRVVRRDPRRDRLAAGSGYRGGECVGVGVDDLAPRDDLLEAVEVDELVAVGEDRDPGPAVDQDGRVAGGGEDADLAGAEHAPGVQDHGVGPQVFAAAADVASGVGAAEDADRGADGAGRFGSDVASRRCGVASLPAVGRDPRVRVLDANDAVGALGHGRAGHDLRRFARTDGAGG